MVNVSRVASSLILHNRRVKLIGTQFRFCGSYQSHAGGLRKVQANAVAGTSSYCTHTQVRRSKSVGKENLLDVSFEAESNVTR